MKVFGNFNSKYSNRNYPKNDQRIFTDPVVHEKYRKYFKNHDTIMNFYLVPNVPYASARRTIPKLYKEYVNYKLQENSNQIFVFFTHNTGVCFTPWILLHRSLHAYDSSSLDEIDSNLDVRILNLFHNFYNQLVKEIDTINYRGKINFLKEYSFNKSYSLSLNHGSFNSRYKDIIYSFINTRCFRNNNVISESEIITECWTQFYYSGKVNLFRVNDTKFAHYKNINVEKVDQILSYFEIQANRLFAELLTSSRGKIWHF